MTREQQNAHVPSLHNWVVKIEATRPTMGRRRRARLELKTIDAAAVQTIRDQITAHVAKEDMMFDAPF